MLTVNGEKLVESRASPLAHQHRTSHCSCFSDSRIKSDRKRLVLPECKAACIRMRCIHYVGICRKGLGDLDTEIQLIAYSQRLEHDELVSVDAQIGVAAAQRNRASASARYGQTVLVRLRDIARARGLVITHTRDCLDDPRIKWVQAVCGKSKEVHVKPRKRLVPEDALSIVCSALASQCLFLARAHLSRKREMQPPHHPNRVAG